MPERASSIASIRRRSDWQQRIRLRRVAEQLHEIRMANIEATFGNPYCWLWTQDSHWINPNTKSHE